MELLADAQQRFPVRRALQECAVFPLNRGAWLRHAGEIFPDHKAVLESLAGLYEQKMHNIASKFLFTEGSPSTLGCVDFKYENLCFARKGDALAGIEHTVDFQPMWAHPLVDIASFMVRSFLPAERKQNEKNIISSYNALVALGVRQEEFSADDCWEAYANRVAYFTAAGVGLLGTRASKDKASGTLDEKSSTYQDLQKWCERLAAAVKDHGLLEKFGSVANDD